MQIGHALKGAKMANRISRHQSIDLHVANQVKRCRIQIGLSQKNLGDAIGLSFQQIQKYESGTNRITTGRLYQISEVLEVPINYFFEDIHEPKEEGGRAKVAIPEVLVHSDNNHKGTDHARDLFVSYYRISDTDVRDAIFALTKQLGHYFSRG